MATPTQRLQSIANSLLNRVATAAQLTRMSDAIGRRTLGTGYAGLTTEAKHANAVRHLHGHVMGMLKEMDGATNVAAALANASSAVDSEMAETP